MKRYSFNQGTLIFNGNTITFELPSNMHQIDPSVNQQFLVDPWSFPTELEFTDDGLKLIYQVEPGCFTFERARVQFMRDTKLNIAVNLIRIGEYFQSQGQVGTVFQPANFFADGYGNVKVMYRGLLNGMPNWGFTDEPVFEQIKRLILLLFSSAKFDELRFNGHSYVNQKLLEDFKRVGKRILQTQSFEEMDKVLKREYEELIKEEAERTVEEPEEKSSFLTIFKPNKPVAPTRQIVRVPNEEQKRAKENRNIILMMIGMGLVFVLYLGMQMFSGTDSQKKANDPIGTSQTGSNGSNAGQPGKSISVNEHLYLAIKYYGVKKYNSASKEFDHLQTKDLPEDEKKIAYYTYYRTCNVDKAISLYDTNIDDMVEDCYKQKKIKAFLESKSTHFEVLFAKALANKNVDEMIAILQKNNIKISKFKGKKVIELLVEKKKVKEANDFAAKSKIKDLIEFAQQQTKK